MGTYHPGPTGEVVKINGTGFLLRSEAGEEWLNISKYARPPISMPRVGEVVGCVTDGSGFVRKLTVVEAAPEKAAPEQQKPPQPEPEKPAAQLAPHVDGKDLRITRLACLNTSTAIIAGTTGRADPDEVIALAEKLELWVLR